MIRKGTGYACMFYGTGYGNGFPDESRADIELTNDGTFILCVSAAEVGQGGKSAMLQIASNTLVTPLDNIKIINDTTEGLKDSGTAAASRQTYNTGNAVKNACEKLKKSIDIIIDSMNAGTLKEVYEYMKQKDLSTLCEGYFKAKTSSVNLETGEGEPYWPYTFAVQKAVVEVDDETGKVNVLEITAAHDVGKAINTSLVQGQIEGGCAMGVGYALMEELEFVQGEIKNKNFSDYIIPTSKDVPHIESIIVEEFECSGPFGAKGVGEPSMLPTAPAIINAIYDAVGVRITSLPASPDKVLKAIKASYSMLLTTINHRI